MLDPSTEQDLATSIKEEGNRLLRAGHAWAAIERYKRALDLQGVALGSDRAPVLGNLSFAYLTLGDASAALQAARKASSEDPNYAKAYFREAKALLALKQPQAAAIAARTMLFAARNKAYGEAKALLDEAAAISRDIWSSLPPVVNISTSMGPASALEVAPDIPALVTRFLSGEALAKLGRCSRRLRSEVCTEKAFTAQAARLCPGGFEKWLRLDLLKCSRSEQRGIGWLYASVQAAQHFAARNRIAVCQTDGRVGIVEPTAGGGEVQHIRLPGLCLPFSLCWGPQGEYLVFTALSDQSTPALVVAPVPSSGKQPLVVPLREGMTPYYVCPSPCGTRIALLGAFQRRQVLFITDTSQLFAPDREKAPPATLHSLGTASPLYFDWAPHAPELLLACYGSELACVRADVKNEVESKEQPPIPTACEPSEEGTGDHFHGLPGLSIRGSMSFRAPQWLPAPAPTGRWLAPVDRTSSGGRVSLAFIDPENGTHDIICEHLPPNVHFSASSCGSWVAWSGMHDERGHGGVFARRMLPTKGPPVMVFNGTAEALTWGGLRLALLLRISDRNEGAFVWAVWEAPETEGGDVEMVPRQMLVAPDYFMPSNAFASRVLPFFDQFERRSRYWSPGNDAIVYADFQDEVWVQPFPLRSEGFPPADRSPSQQHPLDDLVGAADSTFIAPPPYRIARGSYACWSPA